MTAQIPTPHHPALSLWQSLLHRSLRAGDEGLQATAENPAMIAATAAVRALDAGAPPLGPPLFTEPFTLPELNKA